MIFKVFWIIRGLLYKPFFGSFELPSYIGRPVFVSGFKRIFIGCRVRIFPGARLEVVGKEASIHIRDNVSIGQNFHAVSAAKLVIENNCTFAENVMVSNIEHSYQEIGKHILEQQDRVSETRIGENSFVGFGAVIQAGTILGKQCIVGSNAVVRGHFPDYSVIVGVPAKIVKRYDEQNKIWRKTDARGVFIDEI